MDTLPITYLSPFLFVLQGFPGNPGRRGETGPKGMTVSALEELDLEGITSLCT